MAYQYPNKYAPVPLTYKGRKFSVFMVDTNGVGLMIAVFEELSNGTIVARSYSVPELQDVVAGKLNQYGEDGYLNFFIPGFNQWFKDTFGGADVKPDPNNPVERVNYHLLKNYELVPTIDGPILRKKAPVFD